MKKILYLFLLICLAFDTGFSFLQHYSQPLDGDMSQNIVPDPSLKPIFENPLGLIVISQDKYYANPNRFFCHWAELNYFQKLPGFLHKFSNPIDSVYLAAAISKTFMQLALIFLLAFCITGTFNVLKLDFLIASVLITPLFQTNGYQSYMGIIDHAVTYAFFYALPLIVVLVYFIPIFFEIYYYRKFKYQIIINVLWIPIALVVSLSGVLNPGISIIVSFLIIFNFLYRSYNYAHSNAWAARIIESTRKVPRSFWFYLVPVSLFSLYSLYIGRHNSFGLGNSITIMELYSRIPEGIFYVFFQKLGFPVLFIILLVNYFLIKKSYINDERGVRILRLFRWTGIFIILYILLLPLGGFRSYRPYVLRYDTIIPITIAIIFLFGISTMFLIKNCSAKLRIIYWPAILLILFIFSNADHLEYNNKCEKAALKEISTAQKPIVELNSSCYVLSWGKIIKPEDSELNSQLIYLWGISDSKKFYYNK